MEKIQKEEQERRWIVVKIGFQIVNDIIQNNLLELKHVSFHPLRHMPTNLCPLPTIGPHSSFPVYVGSAYRIFYTFHALKSHYLLIGSGLDLRPEWKEREVDVYHEDCLVEIYIIDWVNYY